MSNCWRITAMILSTTIFSCRSTTPQSQTRDATDIVSTTYSPGLVSWTCGHDRLQSPCYDFSTNRWERRAVGSCAMPTADFGNQLAKDPSWFCSVRDSGGQGFPGGGRQPPPPPPTPVDPLTNPGVCLNGDVGKAWNDVTLAIQGSASNEFIQEFGPNNGDAFCKQVGTRLLYLGRLSYITEAMQRKSIAMVNIESKSATVSYAQNVLTVPWTFTEKEQKKAISLIQATAPDVQCPDRHKSLLGRCWKESDQGSSCDDTCRRSNLVFSPATCDLFEESLCYKLMDLWNATTQNGVTPTSNSLGCGRLWDTRVGHKIVADSNGCTSNAAVSNVVRFCACSTP